MGRIQYGRVNFDPILCDLTTKWRRRRPKYSKTYNGAEGARNTVKCTEIGLKMPSLPAATMAGHHMALQELVSAKADVTAPTRDGRTPVYVGAEAGHHMAIAVLLWGKADPEVGQSGACVCDSFTLYISFD